MKTHADRTRLIIYGASAVALGLVVVLVLKAKYFGPRAELMTRIAKAKADLTLREEGVDRQRMIDRRLQEIADRTLGGDFDVVDHEFRTRLSRLAEHAGIEVSVSPTPAVPKKSPRYQDFGGWKELRDEVDFVEVGGSITGQGSLEQVLGLIDRIQSEKWIKRIDQVKLDPVDNGQRIAVNVKLTTIFLPGKKPHAEVAEHYDAAQFARLSGLVEANPFRLPPAVAPTAVAKGPEGPRGFPYEQWAVTGLAEGPEGPEVWLLNQQSSEQKRLAIGQALQDAVFVAIKDDVIAEFHIGQEQFLVGLGHTLSDRTMPAQ